MDSPNRNAITSVCHHRHWNYWITARLATPVKYMFDARYGHGINIYEIVRSALKAILEDPLLQEMPLRSKKALNEVKKF